MSFRTILRYCIDPHFHPEARLDELVSFCREAKVEEVMLFIGAEELSTGFPGEMELAAYLQLAVRARDRLAQAGVALSLNPWFTLYCVPRGRQRRREHPFRAMVGETGAASPIVACPLCGAWQGYLADTFARIAQEVQPVAIWLEDDWRLHNHGSDLGWGGCFCEEHLQRFSHVVRPGGPTVTRNALLDAILQPGPPHPWRRHWLQLSRESLLQPLRHVAQAVRDASPETEVALMSSLPDQHALEGRDWEAFAVTLGNGSGRFLLRPHLRPYTEEWMVRVPPSIPRQTLACAPQAEAYPELENSPRCGIFSKSGAATVFQMLEAAACGMPGITLNSFDMMGNGTALDPRLGAHLREAKPVLESIGGLRLRREEERGVSILFSPRITEFLQLTAEEAPRESAFAAAMQDPSRQPESGAFGSIGQLAHPSLVWGDTCSILGIPHRYSVRAENTRAPLLVNGQMLRAFPPEEVEALFSGTLILDAVALESLYQLGYQHELGLCQISWQMQSATAFSYEEELATGRRMSAQRCASRMLKCTLDAEAEVITQVCRADGEALWAGCYRYSNSRGGTVIALTYPLDGTAQYFMGFFNRFRQRLFRELFAGRFFVSLDGLRCYQYKRGETTLLAIANPTADALQTVSLLPPPGDWEEWEVLTPDGRWQAVRFEMKEGTLSLVHPLPALRLALFRAEVG